MSESISSAGQTPSRDPAGGTPKPASEISETVPSEVSEPEGERARRDKAKRRARKKDRRKERNRPAEHRWRPAPAADGLGTGATAVASAAAGTQRPGPILWARETRINVIGALVGGIIVALLGWGAGEYLSDRTVQKSFRLDRLQEQQRVLREFGDQFPESLNLAYRLRLTWIKADERERALRACLAEAEAFAREGSPPQDDDSVHARIGACRTACEEIRPEWESVRDLYLSKPKATTLAVQVRATFDGIAVHDHASALYRELTALLDAEQLAVVESRHHAANQLYESLVAAMGDELRQADRWARD